jgi:hypothetical protein
MLTTSFQQTKEGKTFGGAAFEMSFVEIRIVRGAAGRSHLFLAAAAQ